MNGRRLGSVSLRLDAVYCAVSAAALASFSPLLSDSLGVPLVALLIAAAAVMVWAVFLWAGPKWIAPRPMLWTVMWANVGAASAVGFVAIVLPNVALAVLVAAVAAEIAAFAGSQAVSLGTS